jgi:hypothetical protein
MAEVYEVAMTRFVGAVLTIGRSIDRGLHVVFSPRGALNRDVPNGVLAIWTAILLGVAIIIVSLAPG